MTPRPIGHGLRRGWDFALAGLVVVAWQLFVPHPEIHGVPFWLAWPVLAIALAVAMAVVAAWRAGTAWSATTMLGLAVAAEVLALWLLIDAPLVAHVQQYDLQVYVAGGTHALHGAPVYFDHALIRQPRSAGADYFLYPPPMIPFVELLASLPHALVAPAWTAVLVVAALVAFRVLGLSWPWAIALLAFPGLVKGMNSGNVANVAFLLYVLGWRFGWPAVLGVLLKVQTVIPMLWLVRERRWRALALGISVVAVAVVVSLAVVGPASWAQWVAGLEYRQQSQVNVPLLYGDSVAAFLPPLGFAGLAVAATIAALLPRGRRGLAAIGIATIVASPSLWPHGFVAGLPALLGSRRSSVLWLGLGIGAAMDLAGLWGMVILATASLVVWDWARIRIEPDAVHPMAGTWGPWSLASDARPPG